MLRVNEGGLPDTGEEKVGEVVSCTEQYGYRLISVKAEQTQHRRLGGQQKYDGRGKQDSVSIVHNGYMASKIRLGEGKYLISLKSTVQYNSPQFEYLRPSVEDTWVSSGFHRC